MRRYFLQPRRMLAWGTLLLLLIVGGLSFLNSKGHQAALNSRASERFGNALELAGIANQPGPYTKHNK